MSYTVGNVFGVCVHFGVGVYELITREVLMYYAFESADGTNCGVYQDRILMSTRVEKGMNY